MNKGVKWQKYNISTSKFGIQHPLAGQNMQQIQYSVVQPNLD